MRKLFALGLSVCAVLVMSCGDDEEDSVDLYQSDRVAIQAILDANGIINIDPLNVATFDTVGGDWRAIELNLRPSSLRGNGRISVIPADIGGLSALVRLLIDSNAVTQLPAQIGSLRRLVSLSAAYDSLTSLPPQLFNATSLTNIVLTNNKIESLPSEIGNLTNVTNLQIGQNQLTSLPDALQNLVNLTWIDFDYNRMCAMTPAVQQWLTAKGMYDVDWLSRQYCQQ